MNSMLTAERFGRWENLWASVMWFSTFFKWVVRSGASGGLAWHTVSSRAMETHAGSIPFSAILLLCRKHTGIDSQWAPLSSPGSGTHSRDGRIDLARAAQPVPRGSQQGGADQLHSQ